jgi:ABC-type Na+ transport system ATPase subunit NatA
VDPVVVRALTKTYPNGVEAVRGISFDVRSGEVFGLLGPNGAGKTTTLGVLTTLVQPSGGTAMVGGHNVVADPLAARGSIGVVFQDSVLDNEFSGEANLRLHARLWRVPDADARIAALLDAVGLAERASDSVGTYSGGMRRRLEIARALLGRPSVLFLDEPTLGLDPIVRQELWHTVSMLREHEHVTVLLSTLPRGGGDRLQPGRDHRPGKDRRPRHAGAADRPRRPRDAGTACRGQPKRAARRAAGARPDGRGTVDQRRDGICHKQRLARGAEHPHGRARALAARRAHDDRAPDNAQRRVPDPH